MCIIFVIILFLGMIFVSETVGFVLLIYKYIFFSHIFVTVSDVPPARELPGGS